MNTRFSVYKIYISEKEKKYLSREMVLSQVGRVVDQLQLFMMCHTPSKTTPCFYLFPFLNFS